MSFRINRGVWQFKKADGTYESKYKLATDGRLVETDALGNEISTFGGNASWDSITGKPSTFTPSAHTHDDRYYTETEVNTLLASKQELNSVLSSISTGAWAGAAGYHGYTYSGGNYRFGFSSTAGVVDVYADGNFYAQEGAKKLATEEYVTTRGYLTSEADTLATVTARGGVTSSRIYADNGVHVRGDWFRVNGNNGLYFESHGGGWNMSDSTWIRAYNNKSIYTGGNIEAAGSVRADSGVYDANVRFSIPGGGYTVNNANGTGGAIKIELPTGVNNSNTMMSMTVHVYEYSTGQSFTIKCGGYNYGDGNWYNVFAYLLNDSGKGSDVPVYFGNNGTRNIIWIGEPGWSWSYPNVFITDFQAGHSQNESWKAGWRLTFDTAARTNVTASRTAYRQIDTGTIGSQSVNYAASAGAVAWSNVSGKPSTFAPSSHTHAISEVTGLQSALDGKQAAGSYAAASHTHTIANVTGLQAALDGKQAAGSYAAASHTHDDRYYTESEVDSRISERLYQARTTTDVNAFNETGLYRGSTSGWSNRPSVAHNGGALLQIDTHPGNYHSQLFFDTGADRLYFRNANAGSWGSWLTMIHSANIGSQSVNYANSAGNADTVDGYHESAFWRDGQDRRIGVLRFTGEGGNSGNGTIAYGIYQEGGDWTHPYPNLRINMHTGISFGANASYGGYRFMSDYNTNDVIFSINDGDANVRVTNNLYIGSAGGWITDLLAGKQAAGSYAAASHTHTIANVTGLQSALDGKQAAGSYLTSLGFSYSTGVTANHVVQRDANGYIYANHINFSTTETENPTINSFFVSNGDGWSRKASVAHVKSQLGLGSAAYTASTAYAAASHTHTIANVTGLQSALDGKQAAGSYAASSHTHTPSQVGLGNVSNAAQVTTTYNTSLNSDSRNSRGVTRLYRKDSDSDYSVQTDWTGSHWHIRGYYGDTFHAEARVGYADSAGSASSASSATTATNVNNGNVYTTGNNLYIKGGTLNDYRIHHNGGDGVFDVRYKYSVREMVTIWSAQRVVWGDWMSYMWFDVDPWSDNWGIGGNPTSWKTVNRGSFLTFGFEDWSDRRHKSAIVEIENAVEKVKAISGYTYWKKGSEVREAGVIAQDVLAVLPEATGGTEDGYSVKPAALIGLLMKAVKEQQEMIDSLTARIVALENK